MRYSAMNRSKLAIAATCIAGALAVPVSAIALTLGNAATQSSLGQALRVVIPVTLNSGENIGAACLKVLSDGGPGDAPQVVTGRVSFEPAAPTSRLVVTTVRPMNDPALRLSIQAGCGDTMRRDYVLLLDPPTVDAGPTLVALWAEESTPSVPAVAPVRAATASMERDARAAPALASAMAQISVAPAVREPRGQPIAPAAATPAAMPDASPASAPRELITLASSSSSGGFISTATAQSLQMVTTVRRPQPSPAATLERFWPYAAMALCLAGLALCALVLRRQRALRPPTWSATAAHAFSKSSGETGMSPNTSAHFSEMTEPAPRAARKPADKRDTRSYPMPTNGELDTLLNDELIDEHTIRKEWAAAASEHAVDIGTDSILQAIAVAEREMRIGMPNRAQLAIDRSLDDDLLSVPKKR